MKSILLDCERMKYPNTGPFNVCLRLGQELTLQKQSDEKLTFLLDKKSPEYFGADASYYKLGKINKVYLPWSNSRFVAGTNKFDLWHATYQSTMYYPLNKRTKVVLTILDLNFLHERPGNPKNKKYLKLIQDRVDRADHIVTISQFGLDDVRKYLKVNVPSSVVYIGGDFSETPKTTTPANPGNRPFLFSLGTVIPKKNFHVLAPVLVGNDYDLVISGINSSDYKDKIIAEGKRFGVDDRIRFTGAVSEEEKNWYYKNCTAFLFPSLAEGFGLPVIEAMTHGKPVFLSTFTSLPEIGGKLAYYFSDFIPENMQRVFSEGMRDYAATSPHEAIKQWASRFSWKRAGEEYFSIYRDLLK